MPEPNFRNVTQQQNFHTLFRLVHTAVDRGVFGNEEGEAIKNEMVVEVNRDNFVSGRLVYDFNSAFSWANSRAGSQFWRDIHRRFKGSEMISYGKTPEQVWRHARDRTMRRVIRPEPAEDPSDERPVI